MGSGEGHAVSKHYMVNEPKFRKLTIEPGNMNIPKIYAKMFDRFH